MKDSKDRKLLLTSVIQPFGQKYGDGPGTSYEGSYQLLWAQGVFRTRATTTQWGIDFIAENLKTPTTTMHYPTMAQFISEIQQGYDYIGIAFVSATFDKMVPMVEAIREHAPDSKIILGGYGAAMGEEIKPYADYICRGEGVKFLRELLEEPVDTPIVQPVITQKQNLFSLPILGRVGYIFAGLGCPNGCDFCATSAFFKRRHIRILPDGPSILRAIERLRMIYPDMADFWINDEDFLLNKGRGQGFLEAIRRSNLPPLSLSIFSSVRALSQFKASELVEMGVDWIWVGYEGKRAGYSKMKGKSYKELFKDLKDHGISVLASMIVGFDYQTPEIIEEEFQELMSLRPSMCQFLIYGPAHGTPLYDRYKAEGRLLPEAFKDHSMHDGFSMTFKHPHIGSEEMVSIQRSLYHREFDLLGPSAFRLIDDWLSGYINLIDHPAERVRAKARRYRDNAHKAMPILPGSKKFMSQTAADWVSDLEKRLETHTGPMSAKQRVLSKLVPAMIEYTAFKLRFDIGQQPKFSRRTYRQVRQRYDQVLAGMLPYKLGLQTPKI
jgi:radical SAM superfamily enzyme YgiQ (UPF0313 family)